MTEGRNRAETRIPTGPRRRLHSRGTFDGCDEIEEASVVSGELVVPGCDTSEVFDLVEEAFDEITFFVEMGVEAAPLRGCSAPRDDWFCAAGGDGVHGALPVISLVRENMSGLQSVEQAFDLGDVVALSACQEEADRVTQSIGSSMDLGAQAAF